MKRFFKCVKWIVLSVVCVGLLIGGSVYIFLQQPKFATPETNYSAQTYPAYENGQFDYFEPSPVIVQKPEEQKPRIVRLYELFFSPQPDMVPNKPLPSVKTDLKALKPTENVVIWMGHSSYFIQLNGMKILVDPVFSDYASPLPMINKAFLGSNIYTAEDMPDIDYLLITHDHWDHLDYPTIMALQDKIKQIVTPLGVGSYFKQWGFEPNLITEGDWRFKMDLMLDNEVEGQLYLLPARHYSGRLLKRNQTLWGSFAIVSGSHKLYLSGDSGYGPHFKQIGQQFGGFDFAALDNGQYNPAWRYVHLLPEDVVQAANDLGTHAVMPIHNSKFRLAYHKWFAPLDAITELSKNQSYRLLTPMIGEKVELDNTHQVFKQWWKQAE
ncbi:MAG: MBL fold metallo-hydrolase [Vibrio sp.]